MAYETRTLAALSTAARQFFTQTIPGAIANVWPNTFTIVGKVLALVDFENELRRQWLYKQIFASTANPAQLYRQGYELGLGAPSAASPATDTMTVACTPGLAIPQGIQYQRADGATFSTRAAVTPAGSTVSLPMQADVAGANGNCPAGTTLTLVPNNAAPAGLGTTGTADTETDGGGFEGGADAETTEAYRQRVLLRKRQPPTGGSDTDYENWTADALSTVIPNRVFVDSFLNDTRWVWVSFLVTDQANGIPSSGEVAIVQAYLSDPIRRPTAARVSVTAPTPEAVAVTIQGLVPNTPDTQAAVIAELAAVQAEQIMPATPNTPFVLFRDWIAAAIERAEGVVSATLVAPSGNLTYSTGGQMPVLQAPTFE
jgi:uncharacterized phage protein gp47/JayE